MTFQEIIKERARITEAIRANIKSSTLGAEEQSTALSELAAINTDYLRLMEDENDAMYASFREGRKAIVEAIKSGAAAKAEHAVRSQYYANCDKRRAQNQHTLTRLWDENRAALEAIKEKYQI